MPSFTEEPSGKDKWCMRRNSSGAFLRTRPRGEIRKFSKGGVLKGPIIRPVDTALFSSSVTSSGFSKALFRFLEWQVTLSPKYRIEKPKRKPFLMQVVMSGSYPPRSGSSLCGFTGVGRQFKWGRSFSVLSSWGYMLDTARGTTLSCGMRSTALKTGVLESTTGAEFARVKFPAHTLWKGEKLLGLGLFNPWIFWCYMNGLVPEFHITLSQGNFSGFVWRK